MCRLPHPTRVRQALLAAVHENARRGAMIRDWTGSRHAGRSGRARSAGRGLKLQSDRQAMRIPLPICVPGCRDFRAPQRSSCIESVADKHGPVSGFHTKITQEIKNIIGFHGRIQPFDNCLVHIFDGRERAAAVADDDRVSEVEVGGEPSVWHSLRRKVEALSNHQYLLPERTNSSIASGTRVVRTAAEENLVRSLVLSLSNRISDARKSTPNRCGAHVVWSNVRSYR